VLSKAGLDTGCCLFLLNALPHSQYRKNKPDITCQARLTLLTQEMPEALALPR